MMELATCISAVENALESILEAVIFLQILEIKYWISVGVTFERNLSELDVTGNVLVRELEWAKPYQSSSRYQTLLRLGSAFDACFHPNPFSSSGVWESESLGQG